MPDDEREQVNLEVGGKTFTIDAPKGLSDEEVIRRTIRADSEFAGLAKTNPKLAQYASQEQAHAEMKNKSFAPPPPLPSEQAFKPQPSGQAGPAARGGFFLPTYESPEEARSGAKQAIIGTATMGAGGAASGMRTLAKMGAVGLGAAGGDIAGDVATGQEPSYLEAAGAGLTAGLLEGIPATAGKLLKPFLTKSAQPISEAALQAGVTQKAFKLSQMANAEEGIRQSIAAAPRAIRSGVLNKLYPTINEPVNIYATSKAAISESGKQIAHGLPGELAKTKMIGQQIGQIEGVIKELTMTDRTLASDPMQQAELLDTMQALHDKKMITFLQARNLRSALGQAIAKGQGYRLPAETFNTLRSVYKLVDDGITEAATAEGKLPQLRHADKVYKQFMSDFYNKSAPLKSVLNFREGMTGKTARQLLAPANVNRAIEALDRWGMKDQATALRKLADMPNRTQAIKDMEEMMVSPSGFKNAQLEAARTADAAKVSESNRALADARNKRLKLAAGAVGGGTALYKGWQWMKEAGRP